MPSTITMKQYTDRLKKAPRKLEIKVLAEMRKAERRAEVRAKRLATTRLRRRTGKLVQSITAKAKRTAFGFELILAAGGTRVPYARIHEFGGVIHHPSGARIKLVERRYLEDAFDPTIRELRPRLAAAVRTVLVVG